MVATDFDKHDLDSHESMFSHGCFYVCFNVFFFFFLNLSVIRPFMPHVNLILCSFEGCEGVRALFLSPLVFLQIWTF